MSAQLKTRMLGEVDPKRIEWLWYPYVPRGEVTELDGHPGVGKSTLWVDLVARLLRNEAAPQGYYGLDPTQPVRVLIFSAEDDPAKILRPKFDVAGVRLSQRVKIADGITGDDGRLHGFQLEDPEHVAALKREIKAFRPTLMVMDPLSSHIGGKTDTHRDSAFRAIVDQLTDLAHRYDVTILGVRHLAKGGRGLALLRAQGNVAGVAAARSALYAGRLQDAEDPTACALAHSKANYGPTGATLAYTVRSRAHAGLGGDQRRGVIKWRGVLQLSADQLDAAQQTPTDDTPRDKAVTFLETFLADGPQQQAAVLKAAKGEGISEKTLRRAKDQLRVLSQQHERKWSWQLPPKRGGA